MLPTAVAAAFGNRSASGGTAQTGLVSDPASLASLGKAARTNDPAALESTARAFESLLTGQMIKQMRTSSSGGGLFDSEQTKLYQDLYDQQTASVLSQGEGLGLRKVLMRQLAPSLANTSGAAAARDPATLRLPERNPWLLPQRRQKVDAPTPANTETTATQSSLFKRTTNRTALAALPAGTQAQWPPRSPAEFIAYLKPYAQQAAQTLGMDTDVLLAQSALETGWGKHIPRRADGSSTFNLFGIKADRSWEGDRVAVGTLEYRNGVAQRERAKFRAYETPAHAFIDYVAFLRRNPRYSNALASSNGEDFIRGLQKAGYATDPRYAAKVLGIRDRFADLSASAETQVSTAKVDKS
ncbi:flagellar assembly peptidoglycan hydrolase FlgJ [Chromatium okenii]|uniref:flagellar assembly peptidoglycan hydrolase FlgJ n=1 Tax=Chromatium okenii TaxID=61644 RepID=UPI0026F21FB9|nr:flagellar assembly peptidoglycan hydrolase FlgJ [Chromatium okenii]MBV5308600.1 flagellar assembly peptidoglycan hydrolase FlgJ [Chromatium okenii]